ncbi:hypothetical protein GCM10011380_25890 [Sphingomonas metalli]|uniref:Uncharacterized protein n=1 Tax=Sphingomonas metalli TaxID=1779358 RepID=A0A916WWF4_9SPHN|nr:hypothetical protein GCM10011380_25890 [Sphingomonas metalli]
MPTTPASAKPVGHEAAGVPAVGVGVPVGVGVGVLPPPGATITPSPGEATLSAPSQEARSMEAVPAIRRRVVREKVDIGRLPVDHWIAGHSPGIDSGPPADHGSPIRHVK